MVLFAFGGQVPVVPFLVSAAQPAPVAAAALSGIALFALGAGITRLTGLGPVRSGLRQLGFGAVAARITHGTGLAVGTALR
jgi:VIT1/CCC1 family predicted Fe2+/Mn2+ transporter